VSAFASLVARRQQLLESVWQADSGLAWTEAHTDVMDEAIRRIWEAVEARHGVNNSVALLATGGYGRREVGPYSDLDIALVPDGPMTEATDEVVRGIFHTVQTTIPSEFGLTVGYAFITHADLPGLDERMLTALMDMRLIAGRSSLMRTFREAFWQSLEVGPFLAAKVAERRRVLAATHDTPLVVEPDLKEGAGGLRCFHAANWLHQAMGGRALRPDEAYDQVLRTRLHLMALSHKPKGLLTRARSAEIAERLGRDPIHLLSDLLGAMVRLHDEYESAERKLREAQFSLTQNVIAFVGEVRIGAGATAGEAAQAIATARRLGIEVGSVRVPVSPRVAGSDVMAALVTGEGTLRLLDRAGILDVLLPELTACRTLVPADPPHLFSVFEHTLRALRAYDVIAPDGFLGEVKFELDDEEPVVLAILLHDVGKRQYAEPHEISGARDVREVAERWKLPPSVAQDAEWLVANHLVMSQFVRLRDVMNAETASDLAAKVQTVNRLNALTLLTWCDVTSVHPEVWTPLQQTFMEELYRRTRSLLESDAPAPDDSRARRRLQRQMAAEADPVQVEAFVASLPAHYVLSHPSEEVRLHYSLAERARAGEIGTLWTDYRDLGASDLTVSVPDRAGLLQMLLGVIYANDLTVHGLRASTTRGDDPLILDQFTVTNAGRVVPSRIKSQIEQDLAAVLSGQRTLEELMRQHGKDPDRRQEIFEWSYHEGPPAILELRAPRGRGMAFRTSRLISELGWRITAARLGQWAGYGAAAFYITDAEGRTPAQSEVIAALGEPGP